MNLELLETAKRTIPDRVDATLTLPASLHFQKKKTTKGGSDNEAWKAASCLAFNWRGAYIAVGYESGTVAVFDVLSRTICALYRKNDGVDDETSSVNGNATPPPEGLRCGPSGVSFLSWSKRSRTLLTGTSGQAIVRLIDTTHPYGPEECSMVEKREERDKDSVKGEDDERLSPTAESSEKKRKRPATSILGKEARISHHRLPRPLPTTQLRMMDAIIAKPGKRTHHISHEPVSSSLEKRYPELTFSFPHPVSSSLQIHPKDACAGIATLSDGSLVAFWVPVTAWEDQNNVQPTHVKIATVHKAEGLHISCATLDPYGDKIYAATSSGSLLGFEVSAVFDELANDVEATPTIQPSFAINVPGGASVSHIVVSRNGGKLILNSADGAIRMYSTKECWTTPEENDKPVLVFQDMTSKVQFCSCDFSGDGEIILAGANGVDKKYILYIWDANTGDLLDNLTGASIEIHSVAWHPTRSFLATAASDGLVDIWGSRVNWTAFAPDFQALAENIEYVEREDEFDVEESGESAVKEKNDIGDENTQVDIIAIDKVPEYACDSENEEDVFSFETKVKRIFGLYTT